MLVGRKVALPLSLSRPCPGCGPNSPGRPLVQSLVKWESENKMVCEQRLLKGEGPKTSWTRELTNDGELILVRLFPAFLQAQTEQAQCYLQRFSRTSHSTGNLRTTVAGLSVS